uniref:Gypsy retrotransposon integrase-like protein 1 n=1 Tax=Oryzias melastigma TaxID=30732 RepID=A0A3B3BUU0_ORYME
MGVLRASVYTEPSATAEAVSPDVSLSDVKKKVTPVRPAEDVPVLPVTLPRFDASSPQASGSGAKLKVRLARLQFEAEEKERVRKAEYELRLQVKKMEIEAEKEIRIRQIELEALKVSSGCQPFASEKSVDVLQKHGFDVSKNIALVPAFRESEVDSYFNAFERIASALDWPRDMWPILLHCKLVGKAQEVVSCLSLQESLDYSILKEAILRAYELVPEAYRQRFRTHKKSNEQTFVEFAREKGNLFDKWCASSNVKDDFEALRSLVLLEDFKNALPERLVVFLNEQKVSSLSKAAVLADEFVLTHRNVFGALRPQSKPEPPFSRPNDRPKPPTSPPRLCFFCHKKGHLIADCHALKKKSTTTAPTKGMGLMRTASSALPCQTEGTNLDPCFKPFISTGTVSLTAETAVHHPIRILRDTGGSQSIIRDDVLSFTKASSCGSSVMIQGVGVNLVSAPLHTVYLESPLVTGLVKVAVLPTLPIEGVDLLLGNDLAGGKVTPVPELVNSPTISNVQDDMTHVYLFPSCVVTRAQSKKGEINLSDSFLATEMLTCPEERKKDTQQAVVCSPSDLVDPSPASRKDFIMAQKSDKSLSTCVSSVVLKEVAKEKKTAYFLDNDLLMRRWSDGPENKDGVVYQVVVPTGYRNKVLSLAHDHPWSGHMGINKTYDRILRHFFWPGLKADVVRYCKTCHECQIAGKPNQVIPPAPLRPIPAIGEPFQRVIIDCVGPLPKTRMGNQFLLTVMCAATRFPEAIPLRKITAPVITKALVKFFTVFGLPTEVQSDQGTNFKSRVFAQALKSLGIKHVTSSPYHPESQGALERFHQTLKAMLRKHCCDSEKTWDDSIPFVLFAAREAVQSSLGFSPAELVFGHEVRGPLKMLKETLISPTKEIKSVPEYVAKLRARLQQACSLARNNLASSQVRMKRHYDKQAVVKSFECGEKVLVLLPKPGSALSTKFSGPYVVEKRLSSTDYLIRTPERRRGTRVCHVNMLKPYHIREVQNQPSQDANSEVLPVALALGTLPCEDNEGPFPDSGTPGTKLCNSSIISNLPGYLAHLSERQYRDLETLIKDFPCLFRDVPSQTTCIEHDIVLTKASPIKQNAYRVNPAKRALMRKEVEYLLEHGFAIPSTSPWSSPCLLEIKKNGSPRFCTDYRKVNAVTVPDAHPLPLIDDCIDEIGPATFVTKLDMLKGYWQVPLTKHASDVSAFVTPDYFLQYTVMPFGMCNAPATFQRLVNKVLGDVKNCRSYLDDIVVYSEDWDEHVSTLREVFMRLSAASLTLNLAKCEFGKGTVLYLGQQVGSGRVRPAEAKVLAIQTFPVPTTRRELRRFLGMAGFYRRFCRNFSSVAAPLTSLTSPSVPFVWSAECQQAFNNLKGILCCNPVLAAPNSRRPFKLEVDASSVGAGAVLLQEDDEDIDHPVAYFSRKFNKHQQHYSTIEKEALALLMALQHFEVYLGSSHEPIQVFTDHNPLVFLSRMYNTNQRLMRWSIICQNFNLDIRHKRGSENVLADALSRAVVQDCN